MLRTLRLPLVLPKRTPLHYHRAFSTAPLRKEDNDTLQSVFEDVQSPLEVTSVLRNGKGFKIRTLANPDDPHTVHGNVLLVDGEYFLWRPRLRASEPGVLDISPESFGILDVLASKPGGSYPPPCCCCILLRPCLSLGGWILIEG